MKPVVQDYLRSASEQGKEPFLRRLEVPVLIWQAPQAAGPFAWGQTSAGSESRDPPSARELLRQSHRLPVLELRQRTPGRPGEVRIGRAEDNDLTLADATVSAHHAVFQRNDQTRSYQLVDQGSTNGSRVNGRMAIGQHGLVLFDGDLLELGDSMMLFFYPAGFYQVLRSLL